MMSVLQRLHSEFPTLFSLQEVGTSVEGRSINLVGVGGGPGKILMWSQMHGDESTATRALLDMLSMLGSNASAPFSRAILEKTTLRLLPMLNPDGAERYERRNALGIDINRDALALQTPEARTLKFVRDTFLPDFAFNLHDQEPRFAVGQTDRIAAIALLAPPYDEARSMNEVRQKAKQLASFFGEVVSHFAPGHVSRYSDTYDPRAFGDRMQQWGTSTVLVESGGWLDDPEKEFLRKLNALGLLASCYAIATGEFEKADLASYDSLPENNENVFDVLIRNARYRNSRSSLLMEVDVAINVDDQRDGKTGEWKTVAQIADVGDLAPMKGFRTIDAQGRLLTLPSLEIGTSVPVELLKSAAFFQD